MEDPITIKEIQQIARKRLPTAVYEYYACGADDERALERNVEAFERLFILPRVMINVSSIDTSTSLFGRTTPFPVAIAPSAMQKLAGGEGELDVVRAASSIGVDMTLSSQSTTSLEEVMAAAKASTADVGDAGLNAKLWFQLYLSDDMDRNLALIKRAEVAGYTALVITVDTPVLGNRLNERKTPLTLPSHLTLANFEGSHAAGQPPRPTFNRILMDARTAKEAAEIRRTAGSAVHSSAVTWETFTRLRKETSMKIILKGIMTPEDAEIAVQHGVDAIVVSNHGGRQLDCTFSTLEALPGIAATVKGRMPIILDGGIRSGADVFKAIALGAQLVLVGRPVLWGLSYSGQRGVEAVLNILERELSRTMALAGVTTIPGITMSYLGTPKSCFGVARL